MREKDKFRGCLIGGAAGDALGYPVEFLKEDQIHKKYGADGICEYDLSAGLARFSDDTQMTLFTATGLLGGTTRGVRRGINAAYTSYINDSYKDWLRTQSEHYPLRPGQHYSWLVNCPGMFTRRAPGTTCLGALRQGGGGTTHHVINHSKGCGGIMRVAPVGLYFCDRTQWIEKEVDRMGAEVAALTHGHPLGWMPAAALVHIIQKIAKDGFSIREACEDAVAKMPRFFTGNDYVYEMVHLMKMALELSKRSIPDIDAIHQLGEGWVAEETLAISMFCALRYSDDIEHALIAAVNHNGDSDSTGSVTGNIVGASVGFSNIPHHFLQKLEMRELILEVADDLYTDCPIDIKVPLDPIWEEKYMKMTYER